MKIAFINPHATFISEHEALSKSIQKGRSDFRHIDPNLTLITLAALTPDQHEVHCVDEVYQSINFEAAYDIVAITAMTFQATRAYQIAEKFKKQGAYVVIGGIHATLIPHDVLAHADTVIVSEAEGVWQEFLDDFAKKKPKPLYHGKNLSLESSPVPCFDLYETLLPSDCQDTLCFLSINLTRGCPLDCEFCASTKSYGRKFRKKSIAQVKAEVSACKAVARRKKLAKWAIYIRDDNPFVDRKYAMEVLDVLNQEDVAWVSLSDIRIAADQELVNLIGQGKCLALSFGLESLNYDVLRQVESWKAQKLKDYLSGYERMFEAGILPGATFVFGLDHDTPASFEGVAHFLDETHAIGTFFIATPLPNTRYALRLQSEGRLQKESYWEKCNLYNVCHTLDGMTTKQLYEGVTDLYRNYHNAEYARKCLAKRGAHMNLGKIGSSTFPSQIVR